ncbi:MAG: energy transducer TonB [Spirochaetes bacterium]|nr:energy transducer TonB [Spirochaetota bacterium]
MFTKKLFVNAFINHSKTLIITAVTILIHLALLVYIQFPKGQKAGRTDNSIFKIVDVSEYSKPEIKKENKVEVSRQEKYIEEVIETDKEIKELDIDYLPQHKISAMPVFPVNLIKSRTVYPPLANKQGIEGIVYLELYIDQSGKIRGIKVLKDPGFGFAEAAVKALSGIMCIPARSNGIPVAARIRYPIKFILN